LQNGIYKITELIFNLAVVSRSAPLWLFSKFGAVYKYSNLLTYEQLFAEK